MTIPFSQFTLNIGKTRDGQCRISNCRLAQTGSTILADKWEPHPNLKGVDEICNGQKLQQTVANCYMFTSFLRIFGY